MGATSEEEQDGGGADSAPIDLNPGAPGAELSTRAPSSAPPSSGGGARPPLRALWVRPLAMVVLAGTAPFVWTRTESSGCGGQPGMVRIDTGYELLFVRTDAGWVCIALAALSLGILWAAQRNPSWRAFFAGTALLVNLLLAWIVPFSSTFALFERVEVLAAGKVAFGACAVLVAEPLARCVWAVVTAVRRWRGRRRSALPPTGAPTPKPP